MHIYSCDSDTKFTCSELCLQELEENCTTTCNGVSISIVVHPPSLDQQVQIPNQRPGRDAAIPVASNTIHGGSAKYALPPSADGGPIVVESSAQVGLLKQFTFTSQMQRMSVLCVHMTKAPGVDDASVGTPVLYVKGAPEKIASLSSPHSGEWRLHLKRRLNIFS